MSNSLPAKTDSPMYGELPSPATVSGNTCQSFWFPRFIQSIKSRAPLPKSPDPKGPASEVTCIIRPLRRGRCSHFSHKTATPGPVTVRVSPHSKGRSGLSSSVFKMHVQSPSGSLRVFSPSWRYTYTKTRPVSSFRANKNPSVSARSVQSADLICRASGVSHVISRSPSFTRPVSQEVFSNCPNARRMRHSVPINAVSSSASFSYQLSHVVGLS